MDVNVHVTLKIEETPELLNCFNTLVECLKNLVQQDALAHAAGIPTVTASAEVEQEAEPAEAEAKAEPADMQITADEVQGLRAAVTAAVKKDKTMKDTIKQWLADNKLEGVSEMKQSQLPAFKALVGAK